MKKLHAYWRLKARINHQFLFVITIAAKPDALFISIQNNIESLKNIFKQYNTSSQGERFAIAQSIAQLEKIAASQTPVYNDKAKNYNDNNLPGRMDCIDSTINTTHYLEFLNQLGLINRHELQQPIYRSPYLMGQHWAAQIKKKNSEDNYAVDSWQTDIGQTPEIQKRAYWIKRNAVKNP